MLTLRSLSLTFMSLLTGFAAVAQSSASGPTPTTVLSWVVWWLAGVVLLMAIITGASATSAVQRRYLAQQAELTAAPKAPKATPGQSAAAPDAASKQVIAPEAVYA